MPDVAPISVVALPAAGLGVIVALVIFVAGLGWMVALGAGVLVALAVARWLFHRALASVLSALGATALAEDEPRLENVVEGLCATHGFAEPSLHVVESDDANVAVLGNSKSGAHLVFTRGLLDGLDRLELEAVVARQLCCIRQGVDSATVVAGVAGLLGSGAMSKRIVRRLAQPEQVTEADLQSVELTRYPPALVSALEKASVSSFSSDPAPATRHLWLLEPASVAGVGLAQPPVDQRIDVLREI